MTWRALRQRLTLAHRMLLTQGFLWHLGDRRSPPEISDARRLMRAAMHRKWPLVLRPIAWFLATFAWPWQCSREARVLVQMSDPRACPTNLRRRSMLAGLRCNVPPGEYGSYGLWRDRAAPADSWVYNLESMAVTAALTDRSVRDLTGDKVRFAEFCRDRCDLPVAETLAVFHEGRCIHPFPDDKPPGIELVSKPVHAAHATGFQVWRSENHAFRCVSDPSGPIVPEDAFAGHLTELSNRFSQGLLVQPFLHSHPEVAHLDEGGPPVARIITGRWRNGTVEVLDAILQKPPRGKYLMTGGSMRLIGVDAGRAKDIHPGAHLFPVSTADPAFDGLVLPGWNACRDGLISLHAAMPAQAPLLGWDVIFAPGGPTILEANTTLSAYAFQTAGQEPVAGGRWMDLLAEYVE